MRWFTDEARANDDTALQDAVARYSAHLAAIASQLPTDLAALATDPRFDLHDGRFRRVEVNHQALGIAMVIDCGNVHVGYRRLTLEFRHAIVAPGDLQLLAEAVGAEFRRNHWHQERTVTEIRDAEVDLAAKGRFILRIRLWPFHEFAIEFGGLSIGEEPLDARSPAKAGEFIVH